MKNLAKHLFSLILPITVLIIVPLCIENNTEVKSTTTFGVGIVFIALGLFLLTTTISMFAQFGKGTLAPWSPTKKLVIRGIYRYVRNPMIIGVLAILIGESIAIQSINILIWAGIFFIVNNLFFIIYEEPNLHQKFGDDYKEYRENVPRWIPRIKPYSSKPKI
jgi:protein-S-isoprenylcysteine O-methyltransferase Ste14